MWVYRSTLLVLLVYSLFSQLYLLLHCCFIYAMFIERQTEVYTECCSYGCGLVQFL